MRGTLYHPAIPEELKTLTQLQALENFHRKQLLQIESLIKSGNKFKQDTAINHLLTGLYGLDVFKLAYHSPTIRSFCEKKEFEESWAKKITLLKTNRGISNFFPATNDTPLFQKMLGLLLAREYNEWAFHQLSQHPAAVELYSAIEAHGITDEQEYLLGTVAAGAA